VDRAEVDEFVSRFADGIAALPDYSATTGSPYVSKIGFEVNHDSVAPRH
jgi:hypothetical protein